MQIQEQIENYIKSLPLAKSVDMQDLHNIILSIIPDCALSFLDGKNNEGKVVSNPNIGYGSQIINYADGSSREFYQIGISANSSGISVYIIGLSDKTYLKEHFAESIGKASISGYCIKFKKLNEINLEVLKKAILFGLNATAKK